MELFSLGIGHYTEQDVREGARAFTGWEINDGKFSFNAAQHDDGMKKFLGQEGKFGGEDIVRICLEQDAAAYFITGKLFRFFVSETISPSRELLEPLAARFRAKRLQPARIGRNDASLEPVFLTGRLSHASQIAGRFRRRHCTGIGRTSRRDPLADALEGLGQRLLSPPSVKGWQGGTVWINSTTLLLRHNLALDLTSTQDNRFGRRTDPAELARKCGKKTDEEIVAFFVRLFLQDDISPDGRASLLDYLAGARKQKYPAYWSEQDQQDHRVRAVCHLLLTQSDFQLN